MMQVLGKMPMCRHANHACKEDDLVNKHVFVHKEVEYDCGIPIFSINLSKKSVCTQKVKRERNTIAEYLFVHKS